MVDTAGNVGPLDSQAITIDTAAPTATVDITAIADDTGTSSSDFITSDTVLTVSGTNTALGAGEKVQISSDGGTTWADVTQTPATTWSYADPTPHATSFTYQARVVDTAGNVGPLDSQAVTIDTAAPTATVDITAIADDTGTSSSDFVTSDTVLTVSGTNTALGRRREGADQQRRRHHLGGCDADRVTTWSYTDPTPHATSFTYQARVVDTAGNVGPLDSQAVTIDTAAPTATVDITAIADDTGTSSSDFITSDTVLTVSGTNTALGRRREGADQQRRRTTWADVTQNTVTTWSYADPAPHATSFTYQARVVDTAGNVGPLDSQAVTIDTAAPTATVDITAIADDTGTSSSDFVTSDTVLTVSGTNTALGRRREGADQQRRRHHLGGCDADTGQTWSYIDPTPHATSFTYQARVVDTAGNAGPLDSQAITIDTAAPTATVDITAIADDTGTHRATSSPATPC